MSRYRATDAQIDREIEALEQIARVRLRRASSELKEIDRDLRELKRERARRRVDSGTEVTAGAVRDEVPT